jgi:PAS domain S-box-containing protein
VQTRLQLASLVADCASRLTAVSTASNLEQQVEQCLSDVARLLQADRCLLLGGTLDQKLSWALCAVPHTGSWPPADDFAAAFPWHFSRVCAQASAATSIQLEDVPPDAEQDWRSVRALGLRSMLTIGVRDERAQPHCLVLQSQTARGWQPAYASLLEMLARALVNTWARRQVEQAREAEVQYVDVLESVGVILWRADARTFQTTFVSREVERILGYPVETWLKVPGFWREHIHPDDLDWVEAFSSRQIAQHRPHEFEYRMVVEHGRVVWLRNIVRVIVEHDVPVALVGVSVDVTERKRAEFEVAQLRYQLMHAGRVNTVGQLSATLAHELNQPLGAIVSNAETALMTLTRQRRDVRGLRGILEDIERDAQRAGQIVHRVRMLLQRRAVEMQTLDSARLANGVVALVQPLAMSRHIDIKILLEPDLQVFGDIVQLQQLLLNLLINAIDAVSEQPENARQIVVRGRDCGSEVEMLVSDSGRGLPAEALGDAFEPFFTTRPGGLGLGLPICRTIVEAHGGRMTMSNNPSGGATVRFTLRSRAQADEGRS